MNRINCYLTVGVFAVKGDDETADFVDVMEVVDTDEPEHVEVAFDFGKERIYLKFRPSDLLRAIKETKETPE